MYEQKLPLLARIILSIIPFGIISYVEYGFTEKALMMTGLFIAIAIPATYLLEFTFSKLIKRVP